jgi:hypothetical protein
MALDIKGFVTPEQTFEGLKTLGETYAAKQTAKAKADELKSAKKAALQKVFEGKFDTKDYLTGTVHDPHITERLFNAKNKVYQFIQEHPESTISDIELFASPLIRSVAIDSDKLKELERQRVRGEAYVKTIPGADPIKFNEQFKKRALLNPDGTVPDDLSGIDITKDYGTDVLENAPIWNTGAIDNLITKAGSGKYKKAVSVRDANKKTRATEIDIESPLNMQPVLDSTGHFAGEFEMPHVLYTENGKVKEMPLIDESTGLVKKDSQGNDMTTPIKMLELEDWQTIKNDFPTKKLIEQQVWQQGKDPNTTEGDNLGRAIAFQMVNASSKAKTKYSEITKQAAAPTPTTNVNVRTGGDKTVAYNPIYDKLVARVDALFDGSFDGNIYKFVPINRLPGDVADGVKRAYANASGRKLEEINNSEFAVNKLPSGELGVFAAENGMPAGNVLVTLSREQLDLGEAKTKERQPILKKGKYVISKYPSNIQSAIRAYMKASGLSESDAISKLIAANKIKP